MSFALSRFKSDLKWPGLFSPGHFTMLLALEIEDVNLRRMSERKCLHILFVVCAFGACNLSGDDRQPVSLESFGVSADVRSIGILQLEQYREMFLDSHEVEIRNSGGNIRAVVLRSGFIAAIDRDVIHIRDRDGRHLSVGQSGSGPSEYRTLSGICAVSDTTFAVLDHELRRLSILDLSGDLIAALPITRGYWRLPEPDCSAGGGVLILGVGLSGAEFPHLVRLTGFRVNFERGELDSLWSIAVAAPNHFLYRGLSVARWADTVLIAPGDGPVAFVMPDKEGSPIASVSIGVQPRKMSNRMIRERVELTLPRGLGTEQRNRREQIALQSVKSWELPAYSEVLSDGGCALWVRLQSASRDEALWLVYTASGLLLGSMLLPSVVGEFERVRIVALRGDVAVLIAERSDGSPALLSANVRRHHASGTPMSADREMEAECQFSLNGR